MVKLILIFMVLFSLDSFATFTPGSYTLDGYGNQITSELVLGKRGLDVSIISGSPGAVSINNFPEVQTVSGAVSISNFPASQAVTGPLTNAELRASPIDVSGSFSGAISGSVSVSNFPSVQVVSLPSGTTVTNFPATQPVSAASLPLPSGAATAANQATEISSLSSIDSKLTAPLSVNNSGTSGQLSNSTITTSASTFTAPANAIGFILQSDSSNVDNVRWAVGSTATSSVGTLMEPGRDTGFVPVAANVSVISLTGTPSVSIQWVIK